VVADGCVGVGVGVGVFCMCFMDGMVSLGFFYEI